METRPRFSAVLTTGIYCREGCPASPKPENVRRYEFAAAAENAGFRACLRCRPYRSSEPVAWSGPAELVCRATRLILDGALDDGAGEDDLGRRLGVSARHLRRLFMEHVGATPDAVARSRRAHFARRLLDDTDLPIGAVGYAAGFGSTRQMNRVMREVFRASPAELRARRRKADRLVADGGLELRLPFRGALAVEEMLGYLHTRAIRGVESVDGDAYRRTVRIDGHPGVLELLPGDTEHVRLRVHLPRWDGLIHVVAQARRILDLDADVGPIEQALRPDPIVGPLVRARPGMRVPGTWDPFELSVRAILGQQVSVRGANTTAARVVECFGEPVAGLGQFGLTHLFPGPESLADAELEAAGLTGARAQAVRTFARAFLDGAVALDASRSLEGTVQSLCALPGIGPWTANYIALRACGHPDAFPAADLGLLRAAAARGGAPLGRPELEDAAEAWRPWRGYAAVHLWSASA